MYANRADENTVSITNDMSFQDILKTQSEEIKPPMALPVGTYLCIVVTDSQPQFAKVGPKQTDCVDFQLRPMQAQSDVDQSQLIEALDGKSLQDKKIRHRMFVTSDSKWRLNQFLVEHLGIDNKGKSIGQLISESPGKQVMVVLGHRASSDGTQIYQEVKSTAHV